MRIIVADPPMIDKIDAVFHVKGKDIIFAWGDTIYNPGGVELTPSLIAHEEIHGARQLGGGGVVQWWESYLEDPQFRLKEEIPAHRAEYRNFCTLQKDRNRRSMYLNAVAARLSGPLYLNLLTKKEALRLLQS